MPQLDFDGAASRLSADNIRGQSGSTITIVSGHNLVGSGSGLTALNATNLASGTVASARLPALGKVLQVVSTTKTDTFSDTNGTTLSAITGLSVNITPSATTSKILVCWDIVCGASVANNNVWVVMYRNSTVIAHGDAASNRNRSAGGTSTGETYEYSLVAGTYLDSPSSTSQLTYSAKLGSQGSITKYVNRSGWDGDVNYSVGRTASTITVMEIGA